MRTHLWRSAGSARIAGALGLATLLLAAPAIALPRLGSAAPAFTSKSLAGKQVRLSQYKGKVVVLNFFSRY